MDKYNIPEIIVFLVLPISYIVFWIYTLFNRVIPILSIMLDIPRLTTGQIIGILAFFTLGIFVLSYCVILMIIYLTKD
uniref:Uncharacterized protein n=1 Tax=viral metagenome TaxID=1070528 RepID=A0A6M3XKL7_9ZZZZ